MKYCEEFAALLDLYVDGELPAEDMIRVQEHLDACPHCQAYVDDLLAIRAAFPDVEDTVVPQGFAEGVMSAIAASAPKKTVKRPTPWKKVLIPMAACLALVVMALPMSGMLGATKQEAPAETAAFVMESAETAAEAPAAVEMPVEAPAEVPDTPAETGVPQEVPAAYTTAYAPVEEESSAKEGRVAVESEPFADSSEPEMSVITTGAPVAVITLPPEGAQLSLLVDRAPDREHENRMEYDLPAADYEMLLIQLDESGLDYIAEEYSNSTGNTILVIIELETVAQH